MESDRAAMKTSKGDLLGRSGIGWLANRSYGMVRQDALLGPFFDELARMDWIHFELFGPRQKLETAPPEGRDSPDPPCGKAAVIAVGDYGGVDLPITKISLPGGFSVPRPRAVLPEKVSRCRYPF